MPLSRQSHILMRLPCKTGLKVSAALEEAIYPLGKKVSDEQMAALKLTRDSFHGEWNYWLAP